MPSRHAAAHPCPAEMGLSASSEGAQNPERRVLARFHRSRCRYFPCDRYETSCPQKDGWRWVIFHARTHTYHHAMQAPYVQSARHGLLITARVSTVRRLVCLVSARAWITSPTPRFSLLPSYLEVCSVCSLSRPGWGKGRDGRPLILGSSNKAATTTCDVLAFEYPLGFF
jgi:hypothetical protein